LARTAPKTIALARVRTDAQSRLEAWVLLADTTARLLREVERLLAAHDMTLPQFDVLSNLAMQDDLTQQDLARRLQVTKGNVCGLIDRLEKQGLVVRRPDARDGRINRLSATPAGRALIERMRPLHDRLVQDLLKPLSADDIAGLQTVLSKL
jgi:MarR family transcriptional regulator, organic hydroperoxide resistance regulator